MRGWDLRLNAAHAEVAVEYMPRGRAVISTPPLRLSRVPLVARLAPRASPGFVFHGADERLKLVYIQDLDISCLAIYSLLVGIK